jgi:hypothetical protein
VRQFPTTRPGRDIPGQDGEGGEAGEPREPRSFGRGGGEA